MGVQERSYLGERPMESASIVSEKDHVRAAEDNRRLEVITKSLADVTTDRDNLKLRLKQATAKIEDMHLAALSRPEVSELVKAIEVSLVALCQINVGECERSRQILCGVHELLQKARLNQGAAGTLPAARIGWESALQAYYRSLPEHQIAVVKRFDKSE